LNLAKPENPKISTNQQTEILI